LFKLEWTIQPAAKLIVAFIPTAERNSPCAARFVAVFLRIEIERRLDLAVTHGISSRTASSFNARRRFLEVEPYLLPQAVQHLLCGSEEFCG
jgi:hypothetical protein